jgi:hypothetical protein
LLVGLKLRGIKALITIKGRKGSTNALYVKNMATIGTSVKKGSKEDIEAMKVVRYVSMFQVPFMPSLYTQ